MSPPCEKQGSWAGKDLPELVAAMWQHRTDAPLAAMLRFLLTPEGSELAILI